MKFKLYYLIAIQTIFSRTRLNKHYQYHNIIESNQSESYYLYKNQY